MCVWVTLSAHWVLPWGSRGQQMASNCLKEEAPHQLGGPTQNTPIPIPRASRPLFPQTLPKGLCL